MSALLARHDADSTICFGAQGARTAAQFAAYARAICATLPEAKAGAHVVLACTDRYHFSAALAAVWMRGFVAELPANGQSATVHAAARRAHALLHDRDDGLGIDVRKLEDVQARAALPLELAVRDDTLAVIAYTSGSTGEPTPHAKELHQLLSEASAHVQGFALEGRRIVAAVPPYHIYGLLFGVLVPLLGGGSMSRGSPLQPAELLRELEEARAEVLVAVPPHLAALLSSGALTTTNAPHVERVFSSAAPLPASTSAALRTYGWVVTEILGSTETGGIAHRSRPSDAWQPLPGVRVDLGHEGLLEVDAPWLPREAERPVRTADRVALEEGGGFVHLGRSDNVVKIGGRRIDLGELEARLKQVPGVRDARVLAIESDQLRGTTLLAAVESDGSRVLAPVDLRKSLAAHVDPVAVPRRFRVVPALPRSETGKVTRRALLALFDTWAFPREREHDGRVRVHIPADHGFFRGHFDGLPILPGVVQLQYLALAETRRAFPELSVLERVSRVKFKRLVSPGETLLVSLTRKGPLAVVFSIEYEGQLTASGILHFRAS